MRFQWKNIVDGFDYTYSSIEGPYNFFKRIRFYSLLRLLIRLTANLVIPFYFDLTRGNSDFRLGSNKKTSNRIVVSLTSFPGRINRVWLVIETILRQSLKPDKIILWLSKEQFPSLELLPLKLLNQRDRGLEIRLMEGDIRSHKKYFYSLKEFPADYILIVDDDIFYRTSMIEDLYKYSLRYPFTVISQYGFQMAWVDGNLKPYIFWSRKNGITPNLNSFFGSGGGTLFPPNSLAPDITNMSLFMSITPTADDVWLNAMCRLNRTKVVITKSYLIFLPVIYLNNITLSSINLGLNLNDKQINSVREYFIKNQSIDPFQELIENYKN